VIEGKVSCADCHDPHKGDAVIAGGTKLMSQNEVCGKCHTTQFGPFTFEHEAMKEGCVTCHQPHGSVNQKMLITRGRALCLKCHFEQQGSGLPGHNSTAGGTCWSSGCHEAIHGSQVYNRFRY
jgi:DmsE family decaheme c-type cytochrome